MALRDGDSECGSGQSALVKSNSSISILASRFILALLDSCVHKTMRLNLGSNFDSKLRIDLSPRKCIDLSNRKGASNSHDYFKAIIHIHNHQSEG